MNAFTCTLAQAQSFRATEIDLPESTAGILLLFGGLVALFGVTAWSSLRDTRFLGTAWRTVLLTLRATVLVLILLVLLNPRERSQDTQIQKSRVGVLIDTSLSMAYPAADTATVDSKAGEETRSAAVYRTLVADGVVDQLSDTHTVVVQTFDAALRRAEVTVADGRPTFSEGSEASGAPSTESDAAVMELDTGVKSAEQVAERWRQVLQPTGSETRMGEALHQLVSEMSGRTLSGIVVVTDGRSNAGLAVTDAQLQAERSEARLIVVGVGSDRPQVNLRVAGLQSPTDVHRGDPFDISVTVQGSGLQNQAGQVVLYQQSADNAGRDRQKVAEQRFELTVDGVPAEVRFQQQLSVPGRYEFVAEARLDDAGLVELTVDDNQRQREVEVTDRKQKVLVISSGPMRDYQFVRNTLFRHSGIESDVWLQTVTADNLGFVTQEAEQLLTAFPKTEAELFKYDVIVGFDPDWSQLSADQQRFLNRWVGEHSGGMIFVAGELFTPELARDADKFRDIAVLYPVVLNRIVQELRVTQRADTPWPVVLTPEGRASGFLRIVDATGKADVDLWQTFSGIYRSYPVRALRDGAIVLAHYGNPRARTQQGQPPFLATQFYGKGRTTFISSAETWRLRSVSAEGHQRFWTSLIRDVGQGRRSRGRSRGLLLLDRTEVSPGQSVTIRAQLYDSRMQPLQRDSVQVSIVDEAGRPVSVPDTLRSDGRQLGQFVNTFRPARQGRYRVTLPVPESSDVVQEMVEVVLPDLESDNPSQNKRLLTRLAEGDGNHYLTLEQAGERLADLLPDRSEPVVVDEQVRTLWDRRWLMILMVGLLSLEWVFRRIVRLS